MSMLQALQNASIFDFIKSFKNRPSNVLAPQPDQVADYSSYHIAPDNPFAGNAGFYYMPELFQGAIGSPQTNRKPIPQSPPFLSYGNYIRQQIKNTLA